MSGPGGKILSLRITPSRNSLAFRPGDFSTLVEALNYAAKGDTGANFFTGRGEQYAELPYRELRVKARRLARKLIGLGLEKGERVGLVAETRPDFLIFFFACQYAGLVPVAFPATLTLGGHEAYVQQLARLIKSAGVSAAMASSDYISFLLEALEGYKIKFAGDPADFDRLEESDSAFPSISAEDTAYLQFTSGSTRFPRGVVIKQKTVMSNLTGIIKHGIKIRSEDRIFSWLPFYHDMGMVGLLLVPVASQMSVDYLDTRDFAVRPRQWLNLMSRNKNTISFGPSFGYELCTKRIRSNDAAKYDLSHWRMAGIGAEMIRPESMEEFARVLEPAGFKASAFLACYGMAECSLAISFAPISGGVQTDCIDANHLSDYQQALPVDTSHPDQSRAKKFVKCGFLLPDFELQIRDESGELLPDRHCGTIFLRGPSVMSGYFNDPESTKAVLSEDGWLDTGDLGYQVDSDIVITGRKKDLIIINGKNIWPQDLEYLAEQQPEIRVGGSLAFSVDNPNGGEICVLKIQCRQADPVKRSKLIGRLTSMIRSELGIDCYVTLVSSRKLPRTSSGKLSRSKARSTFLATHDIDRLLEIADENELRKSIA